MILAIRKKRPVIIIGVLTLAMAIPSIAIAVKTNATTTINPQIELVTVNSTGVGGLSENSYVKGLSADGDKILFTTAAKDVPGAVPWKKPNSPQWAAYIKTMSTGTIYNVGMTASNISAMNPVMNTTGRYVAFTSKAIDFSSDQPLPTGTNLLLQDTLTDKVELIASITMPHPAYMYPLAISDDGRFVVVKTRGGGINDAIPGARPATQEVSDIILYDRTARSWTVLNRNVDGSLPTVDSVAGNASCDASFVVFSSTATTLTDDHTGSGQHLYMADIRNGLKVTDLTPGATGNSVNGRISCNGRYISYDTEDRTLISPQPQNYPSYKYPGAVQLARYDRFTNDRQYLSKKANNTNYSLLSAGKMSTPSDNGDVAITYSFKGNSISDENLFLKRAETSVLLSDPLSLSPLPNGVFKAIDITFELSSDGRYIVASTGEPAAIGQPLSTSASDRKDIYRIKIN